MYCLYLQSPIICDIVSLPSDAPSLVRGSRNSHGLPTWITNDRTHDGLNSWKRGDCTEMTRSGNQELRDENRSGNQEFCMWLDCLQTTGAFLPFCAKSLRLVRMLQEAMAILLHPWLPSSLEISFSRSILRGTFKWNLVSIRLIALERQSKNIVKAGSHTLLVHFLELWEPCKLFI